jgi:hypothetical protein
MDRFKRAIKWMAVLWVLTLGWMYFERAMGWHGTLIHQHALYTNVYDLIFIVVFFLALLETKKKQGGIMDWIDGFWTGMIITLGMVIMSPLTQILTHKVISPEFFPNIIRYAVESGFLQAEQAEAQFNLEAYMVSNAVGTLLLGTITSAVVALVLKTRKS